ncbi:TadE family type IV pilus minor pilin [Gordonia sp. CPCC 206044]
MVTVEAAYAIAAIVTAIVLGVGAVGAGAVQIRCTDAAREAARLTASDDPSARAVAQRIAGRGAQISIDDDGEQVVVQVRSDVPVISMIEVSAFAVADKEPDGADVAAAEPDSNTSP